MQIKQPSVYLRARERDLDRERELLLFLAPPDFLPLERDLRFLPPP